ncbi:MAG: imidazolonepropionase [Mesorhizobium sp.]|uniref:imidazolonepropionase n=1 Tax=unclassified Mesorhizobium TaxID=325217 RepID=UPI000FCCAA7B|nr:MULTISPECIES: imidazolonepropionase [unclassified Mesorhizobium]RUV75389.1 imidazolonepropionase [Mesorhizobium sp. M5C.F.Cr.IN.023.01.1.1]RWF88985.1 MAG: imidazolonepropionase [Mesorhizobium sp.]RWF95588.1 MAG: imidazolonepropionase [Mesorhizobium sp.]RWI40277.1 MAG: imidazolonepropionase [Mesorhizobium sp.]RWI45964.1 MAG: imidazolonepropionase [Mesorhizobium sp.]
MVGESKSPSGEVRLWRNARLATMAESAAGLGIVEDGAIAARDGRIVYAGPEADMPAALGQAAESIDCEGRWITPGLIDCHTHLVHAGNRANEFEMRLAGATYEEVTRAGGGIVSSVKALRAASEHELVVQSVPRLNALIAEGLTTIEIKSGYGLDLENEKKSLRAARLLGEHRAVTVRTSFLGAHALPPEAKGDKDAFIDLVAKEILPAVAAEGLTDAVDGFCEGIAFSPEQISRVFDAAKALSLPVKLHADQLSNLHGAELAARYGALSADHLEYTDGAGAAAMARAGTVATILPGAYYFIRETKKPPIGLFRQNGVKIAVATDCNPGTSPLTSLLLTMNMAATLFGLTVDECLAGVTREAARALGLLGKTGTLEAGKSADLAIWDIDRPAELVYRMGFNPLHARIWRGR